MTSFLRKYFSQNKEINDSIIQLLAILKSIQVRLQNCHPVFVKEDLEM